MKKTELTEILLASETRLLSFLENVNKEFFLFKPSEIIWSIAEIIEHIILVEEGILMKIQKSGTVEGDAINTNFKTLQVVEMVGDRSRKAKAPEYFLPKGLFLEKEKAIQAFKISRAKTINFVQTTNLPLHDFGFKHFAFGMLDGSNWIAFIAGHCNRHVKQMEMLQKTSS